MIHAWYCVQRQLYRGNLIGAIILLIGFFVAFSYLFSCVGVSFIHAYFNYFILGNKPKLPNSRPVLEKSSYELFMDGWSLKLVKRGHVTTPSATFLLRISRFLLPAETHKRLVVQAVLDMWEQQHEALSNGELWRYRWIGFRDQGRIILALAMEPFSKLLAKLISPFLTK